MNSDKKKSAEESQGESARGSGQAGETEEKNDAGENETPKGKVSCLLCRGFISYKNSDRSRFRDHMESEHDVKFDSDVILALSVMSKAEKKYIVESAMTRLGEIGNNQIASSGETLLPPAKPSSPPLAPPPSPAGGGRGRALPPGAVLSPQVGRGRARGRAAPHTYRGTLVRAVRPVRPAANLPPPVAAKVPLSVQNMSISISLVDQTAKCSQCSMTFKNSSLLAEHTKTVHLARFSNLGLSITTPVASPAQSASGGKRPADTGGVRTPPTKVLVQSRPQPRAPTPRGRGRGRGGTTPLRLPAGAVQVKTESAVAGGEDRAKEKEEQTVERAKEKVEQKVDPVIKCNDCAQFIKQSVFKQHKLEHLKAKSKSSTSSSAQVSSPKPQSDAQISKDKSETLKTKKREEKQIDFVDLGDVSDEEEITDITQKKILEKTIPCPSCDVMFATNMSLKMHLNLQHPVKAEAADNTEQLLSEEKDNADERDEKIRDEMNTMGTSEMLDDLVSFLNEL